MVSSDWLKNTLRDATQTERVVHIFFLLLGIKSHMATLNNKIMQENDNTGIYKHWKYKVFP